VNALCGDEAGEEVVVTGGDLAAETQCVLAKRLADQVVGHVFDGGEIGRRMIGSDPALVVAEDHVHHPMQAVLGRPVTAHDRPQQAGRQHQRG